MTAFDDTKAADTQTAETETKTTETKAIVVKEPPASRVKSNPKLWHEAAELADMLTFCRPHLSRTESKFIAKYLVPLKVKFDKFGNAYKQIGDNPTVLWSCHTDTVHDKHGFQKILYWHHTATGEVWYDVDQSGKQRSSCLGADDTAGLWLMVQMIRNKVPGLYIFHRGEEVGGKGSSWIAEKNKDAVNGIKYAIAFDRKDEKSIITFQGGTRCCSDEFAKSLADQLDMGHECDTGGAFTDTKSYVDLIPECTNVSVGYMNVHFSTERLNVDYLFRLRDALLKLDISKLVEKRKPGENTRLYTTSSHNYDGWGEYSGYGWWANQQKKAEDRKVKRAYGCSGFELRQAWGNHNWMDYYEFDGDTGLWYWVGNKKKKDLGVTKRMKSDDPKSTVTYADAVRMVKLNPEAMVDLLESLGLGPREIQDHLLDHAQQYTIMM